MKSGKTNTMQPYICYQVKYCMAFSENACGVR